MSASSRANVVSSFSIIKGALISETYTVFERWDFSRTKRENIDQLKAEDFVGAGNANWLLNLGWVLNRRFDPAGRDRGLVLLAKNGCSLAEWKPLLLWHMTRDEFLLRDFLTNWLFPAFEAGVFRMKVSDVLPYLEGIGKRGAVTEHTWTPRTSRSVAAGLLKLAADFELLKGGLNKEFASYHLPERSFLYLLHAIREDIPSPAKAISSPDWRLFLMRPSDVERELLRLHQFRKLDYQVAGSLVQLSLPARNAFAYAEGMGA